METPAFGHQRVEEAVSPSLVIQPSTVNNAMSTAAVPSQDESTERDDALSPKPDITDEIQYVAYSDSVLEPSTNEDSLPQNCQPPIPSRRSQRRKRALEACGDKEGVSDEKLHSRKRRASGAENWLGKSPVDWSMEEVASFVDSVPYCNLGTVFREHVSTLHYLLV